MFALSVICLAVFASGSAFPGRILSMFLRIKIVIGVSALVLCSLAAVAEQRTVTLPPLRGSMIVTTDWLADHARDPKIIVLHIGRDRTSYDEGHIPGARFVALSELAVARNGVANELPPVADLQKIFERVGLSDDSRAILYGDLHGLLAARAYWTLDYLGHGDRAALLDGGLEKWRAEERPVTKEAPSISVAKFTPKPQPHVLVDLQDVQRISREVMGGASDSLLVDARPAEQFTGEQVGDGLKRGGHIPGALSIPWADNIESTENPELRPPSELRKRWTDAGVLPGKRTVVYCRTGIQAAYEYFVGKFLGYNVALYDGSMMEWTMDDNNPVHNPKITPSGGTNR